MTTLMRLVERVCAALGCPCGECDDTRLARLYVEDRKAWRLAAARKHRLAV
jgi:hypothetical protein